MKKYKTPLIILIGLLLLFLLTAPKVSVKLFGFKRQFVLNNFLKTTVNNQNLDAGEFWKFREFYYPGYITVNKLGYSSDEVAPYVTRIDIPLNPKVKLYPFLIFHSDKFVSVEYLVQTDRLNNLIAKVAINPQDVIWQDATSLIYRKGGNIKIVFLKTDQQMVVANGFLSPLDKNDRPLYQGKHWFVISSVNEN